MTNMKTDNELKQLLAKMLPEQIFWSDDSRLFYTPEESQKVSQIQMDGFIIEVKDTELLHICWLIEQTLTEKQLIPWLNMLSIEANTGKSTQTADMVIECARATWQQRTLALAKMKGLM